MVEKNANERDESWGGRNAAADDNAADTWPRADGLFDAHCHLDWFADAAAAAEALAAHGVGVFAVTVTPTGYEKACQILASSSNVFVAAGLHPWWLADGRAGADEVDALCEAIPHTRYVGEVGLDFSPKRIGTDEGAEQVAAFHRICEVAASTSCPDSPTIVSIHAVRAANTVLDILAETHCAERCRCVLHWFSGSSTELWRAVRMGVSVSLGEHSLATKRGREYARIIPEKSLLIETDYPPGEGWAGPAEAVSESLTYAVEGIALARGLDTASTRTFLARNAHELMS